MSLTAERLVRFDLLPQLNRDQYFKIHTLISEARALHTFIVEMPAYPRIPSQIFRGELIRAVGSTTSIEGNTLTAEEIERAFEKADKKGSFWQLNSYCY